MNNNFVEENNFEKDDVYFENVLKGFFLTHVHYPYPTKAEVQILAEITETTQTKIKAWFVRHRNTSLKNYKEFLVEVKCGLIIDYTSRELGPQGTCLCLERHKWTNIWDFKTNS